MVIVWGELLWDRFPDGAQLGGAPANVAWHLAGLGTPVALVTRVGDDVDGAHGVARLAAQGVDVGLVQRDPDRATGEVTVELVAGEPRYQLCPGRAWEAIELTDAAAAALPRADALVYGTLAQRTPAGLAALTAALAAAPPTVLRVCDPNLRGAAASRDDDRALAAALAAADVVKLGDREVAAVAARLGWPDPVAHLRARGARLVIVTHGAGGSTWHDASGARVVAAVPARPGGDNVGCGDAFVAAVVHGLVAGWRLPRVARLASAVAAEVAAARGATPTLDGPALIARTAPEPP
ncbi:MAG: PfkB family carbohydrate kinase [Kofleriaceae bacterium]